MIQKANWRPLQYIYKKRVATLMHDRYYKKAPTHLLNLFEKQSQTRTRQKHCFEIFRPKTVMGQTALRYRGPITWNALPTETKKCENRTTFKIKLKRDKIINEVSYKKKPLQERTKLMTFIITDFRFCDVF